MIFFVNIFKYSPLREGITKMIFSFHLLFISIELTLKHRETHGCVVSTVATDALVLKQQVISILNAD